MKMRTLIFVLALAAATMAVAKAPGLVVAGGQRWVGVGGVYKDGVATRDVKIVNAGDSDLVLYTIFSGCRCAWAKFPRTPIAPGDTAVLEVGFDATNRIPGGFVRQLKIRSNDPRSPATLLLRGDIERKR